MLSGSYDPIGQRANLEVLVDRTIVHPGAAGSVKDRALRRAFERAYRIPGVKYLGAACALGTCAVTSYYLLDVFHAGFPWTGGAQQLDFS